MKKSMKGTIAIAAGIALLLGGGGSLAYWQGSAQVSSATIQTGELSVALTPGATWQVKRGSTTTDITSTLASFKMVPGDTVVYTVPFQTKANGTNLTASGAINWGGYATVPAHLTSTAAGTYNSTAITGGAFTAASGTANGQLVFTLTWPFGANATNDTAAATMNQSWNLASTTVTVTQTANGAS
ncbi:alternate-type signal peptide domain-containing protein [Microbacterium sulfonylureivorans]|uniref:alternate-type signal peptide domain-containing protein n=1 Tax=Microbacterium sulfonylureivorans TaxID=2486854 RepID=UPI000FD810F1|nr:alternate-type signal peptide domain-containing protein [Microbacterium sulfonylureivorans]